MRSLSTAFVCVLLLGFAAANDRSGACGSRNPSASAQIMQVGAQAPDLRAKDHRGQTLALLGADAPMTLVYFYPKDNTPG